MVKFKKEVIYGMSGVFICAVVVMLSYAGAYGGEKELSPGLIAFSRNDDNVVHIFISKPDGTDIRATSNDSMTRDWYPSWSPDRTRIAFSSNQSDDYDLWIMDADGSNRRRITYRLGLDTLPRWSPDGKRIVFAGIFCDLVTSQFSYDICVVNSDGRGYTRLTHGAYSFSKVVKFENNPGLQCSCGVGPVAWSSTPTWSPDGSKILFASNVEDVSGLPFLYTMDADGSNIKKMGLISGIVGSQPDWSPANNKIVFTKLDEGRSEIWVIDAGFPIPEWTVKKLTNSTCGNHSPVWSSDGKHIAFTSNVDGKDSIFIMNADGTDVHRLTCSSKEEIHPSWR